MLKECSLCLRKMSKQNATATIEGVRKRDQQRKGWIDEAEEYINIMGTKNRQAMVKDRREWRKIVLEAKVQNGGWCWIRRRKRGKG